MAIFPNLEIEEIVQVDDKTRLDATKSFVSKGEAAITLVRIEPHTGDGFVIVTGSSAKDYYLDWQYSTDGTKTVSVEITTDGAPVVFTKTIEVLTLIDDKLFSNDQDLMGIEPDILRYVRPGRNSWLDFHRKSQFLILDYLNDSGIFDTNGDRLTKAAIIDIDEVNKWSKYQTLALIYEDLSNAVDDVFAMKNDTYEKKAGSARYKSGLKLDLDGDGIISVSEGARIHSTDLVRT